MIIEVEGLRKSFGTVEALRGVDFSVPEGKVLGLLGPMVPVRRPPSAF